MALTDEDGVVVSWSRDPSLVTLLALRSDPPRWPPACALLLPKSRSDLKTRDIYGGGGGPTRSPLLNVIIITMQEGCIQRLLLYKSLVPLILELDNIGPTNSLWGKRSLIYCASLTRVTHGILDRKKTKCIMLTKHWLILHAYETLINTLCLRDID